MTDIENELRLASRTSPLAVLGQAANEIKRLLQQNKVFTAAAEVGGPTGNALVTVMADRRCLSNGCQYADAIERCAQALDDRAKMHSNPDIIEIIKGDAAAIRALEDKP